MTQQNPKSQMGNAPGSQFESSGFGGSMFASQGNSQFGAPPGGNSGFPTSGGTGPSEFGQTNFGGGTNAVSQIFKDGGYGGDNRRKIINYVLIGVAIVGLFVLAMWYMSPPSEDAALEPMPTAGAKNAAANGAASAAATAEAATDEGITEEEETEVLGEEESATAEEGAAEGSTTTTVSSGSWEYNEEEGGPVVAASAGARVEVSLSPSFSPLYVTGRANGSGQFQIPAPPPGKVYWREAGASSGNEMAINPPPRVSIRFSAPSTLAQGAQLNWEASGPASFYRVEFASDASFNSLSQVFATTGNSIAISNLGSGSYFVRVSGFNTKAGKWESSSGSAVTVQ